jgi:hypothetical protein
MPPSGFFDLMRQCSDEWLLVGLRLIRQTLFTLLTCLLLLRQQLNNDFRELSVLRHDHMHGAARRGSPASQASQRRQQTRCRSPQPKHSQVAMIL